MPTTVLSSPKQLEKALVAFRKVIGKAFVLTRPEELATYECDACLLVKARPCAVLLPNNTAEVSALVDICNRFDIPYIARGGGTGLSGGAVPITGGVIIGLNRMNRIIEINHDARTATVEVGVVNGWLNEHLQATEPVEAIDRSHSPDDNPKRSATALRFAPDPSSQSASTIGGNIAENAGGIHCLKYGVTTDHVLALEVVLTDGSVVWLGNHTRQAEGLNLAGLMVGSEGTLGIVTQAVVKLVPKPTEIRAYLAAFDTVDDAGNAVSAIIAQGMVPAALEFMDAFTVKAVNEAFHVGFPESSQAVLLVEVDGHPLEVNVLEERIFAILIANRVTQLRQAQTEAERQQLWKARKLAVAAYGRYLPAFYLHDTVIPRSEITTVLKQIHAIAKEYNLVVGNVFHAGDGNLHPNILFDPDDKAMMSRMLEGGEKILEACLAVGGTLSGEHGIGLEKSQYMDRIFSEADLAQMKAIKTLFDPKGLANPEKIFPVRKGCGETHQAVNPQIAAGLTNGEVWI